MKNIAIIPARSGSKGLKDKNIKDLCGKPLMAYSIEAAVDSGLFDVIHVSTDSEEYANIAVSYGADVPFLRTPEISGDNASSWDAVRFVLERYRSLGKDFDNIVLLQPTSPLRNKLDIIGAFQLFKKNECNAVIGVCEAEVSPTSCGLIGTDFDMAGFVKPEYRNLRRQDQPTYYRINGAVYILKKQCLNNIPNLYDDKCFAYVMDERSSIDIDDELDFKYAELIMQE